MKTAFDKTQAFERLSLRCASVFKDFITGLPASNEIEFSAALAVLHSWGKIDWKRVPLRSGSESPLDAGIMSNDAIATDAAAFCEYPLFSTPGSDGESKWGAFRADVLFLAKDRSRIAYVENKIKADIRMDMITGTIQCLENRDQFEKASFILLTGKEFIEAKWYRGELRERLVRTRSTTKVG